MTDVEARTIGASAHAPVIDSGRWPDTDVLWNVPRIDELPVRRLGRSSTGTSGRSGPNPMNPSQMIGTPPAPLDQHPQPGRARIPTARRATSRNGLAEVSNFLQINGAIENVCGPKPCYGGFWTGL